MDIFDFSLFLSMFIYIIYFYYVPRLLPFGSLSRCPPVAYSYDARLSSSASAAWYHFNVDQIWFIMQKQLMWGTNTLNYQHFDLNTSLIHSLCSTGDGDLSTGLSVLTSRCSSLEVHRADHYALAVELLSWRPGEPCAWVAGRPTREAGTEAGRRGTCDGQSAVHESQRRAEKCQERRQIDRDPSYAPGAKVSEITLVLVLTSHVSLFSLLFSLPLQIEFKAYHK